jgi:hypothetical protein
MSRHEEGRHRLPLPEGQRREQPFVLDWSGRSPRLTCPSPRKRPQPGDEACLDAVLARLDLDALPAAVCWCWPDRDPKPVRDTGPSWLPHWARDRQAPAAA